MIVLYEYERFQLQIFIFLELIVMSVSFFILHVLHQENDDLHHFFHDCLPNECEENIRTGPKEPPLAAFISHQFLRLQI